MITIQDIDPLVKPIKVAGHTFPGIWRYMLPKEFFDFKIPRERRSTCSKCPKIHCEPPWTEYRCCTYEPLIPNYLLGLALLDSNSKKIIKRLRDQGLLLPHGMQSSPEQLLVFLKELGKGRFGYTDLVLCPFMNRSNGYCQIYRFRNAICSTFFCYYDNGDRGSKFWQSLRRLLLHEEAALSQWALAMSGFDIKAYFKRLDRLAPTIEGVFEKKNRHWKKSALKYLWGDWYGNELELYERCGESISQHRKELWNIAKTTRILAANQFVRALLKRVPKAYYQENDSKGCKPLAARALWTVVKDAHRALRSLPDARYTLSSRVRIEGNKKEDAEEKFYRIKPVQLLFLDRHNPLIYVWREFLSEQDAQALKMFSSPKKIDSKNIDSLKKYLGKRFDPVDFLSEWVGKKVLVKERSRCHSKTK